jgi:hypothetical protein
MTQIDDFNSLYASLIEGKISEAEFRATSDQDVIAEAMGLERARLRLQAVASAVARSPEPERWQHLIVAASGAWARAKAFEGTW